MPKAMDLTFNLEWKNLSLQIKKSEFSFWRCKKRFEEKTILNDVSGSLKSGQLVAILGESGAGKTTLLAAISYRFRGPLDGQLLLNGTPIDRKTMTKISCFMPQFDITLATLTPNEHLHFMAELKLDPRWSRSRKYQRVAFLLRELGLQEVADNRISTLSGGERKKLNLATDLLTNPPIIFCDEITTGLDSFNARKVIESLKHLSNTCNDIACMSTSVTGSNGESEGKDPINISAKAIICSIHQPTSDIFQCFSQIILMHAGRAVFQGKTEEAFDYFSRLGHHCPVAYNPADFFIKVLSHTENKCTMIYSSMDESNPLSDLPLDDDALKPYENHSSLWLKQVVYSIAQISSRYFGVRIINMITHKNNLYTDAYN